MGCSILKKMEHDKKTQFSKPQTVGSNAVSLLYEPTSGYTGTKEGFHLASLTSHISPNSIGRTGKGIKRPMLEETVLWPEAGHSSHHLSPREACGFRRVCSAEC